MNFSPIYYYVITRLNSSYRKIERFYSLKETIIFYCEKNTNIEKITPSEFEEMQNYIKLLSRF
jgi:hypothetical protein